MAHRFRGFRPWLLGPIVFGPLVSQNIMVGSSWWMGNRKKMRRRSPIAPPRAHPQRSNVLLLGPILKASIISISVKLLTYEPLGMFKGQTIADSKLVWKNHSNLDSAKAVWAHTDHGAWFGIWGGSYDVAILAEERECVKWTLVPSNSKMGCVCRGEKPTDTVPRIWKRRQPKEVVL